MLKDFKEFILKGNVIDMAVGIIIGLAFGKIVTSFVNDILMPPIGLLLGGLDFSNLYINLTDKTYPSLQAAKAAGAATLNYGIFINTIIDFLIIGLAMFLLLKVISRVAAKLKIQKKEEALSNQEKLLTEIRDLLKHKSK